jgi:sulfatase modifying factor 1
MKKVLMYDKYSIGKSIIELNKRSWGYDYYNSQSVIQNSRYRDSSLIPIRLIPFDYKGIEFNMITCPNGEKNQAGDWGYQEIKEPFMLGENEVTQELFEAVMDFNYSSYSSPKNPVEMVTWYDCIEFCNRLSVYFGLSECYNLRDKSFTDPTYCLSIEKAYFEYIPNRSGFRLPTATEWMIAARSGTNNKYAGANDDDTLYDVAWFQDNCDYPQPVAQKLPNEWGFYDMSGNVYEWVDSKLYPNQEKPDASRLFLGGSYGNGDSRMDLTSQDANPPYIRNHGIGFRIARSI